MGTGINEVDELVEGGKSAVADVKSKWKMKLAGVAVAGIGALLTKYSENATMNQIGIGVIVVGVLMILGTGGIVYVVKQIHSAGKNRPRVKL